MYHNQCSEMNYVQNFEFPFEPSFKRAMKFADSTFRIKYF